jgi:hypothetical protein
MAARFDATFLKRPGLVATVLEIEICVIDATGEQLTH